MTLEQENLTAQQRTAAERCLAVLTGAAEARQIVLAGYAGTGKTWTTGAVVRALLRADRRVCVVAPTHKALAQVRERAPRGVACYTMHQALGLRMRQREDGGQEAVRAKEPPVTGYHCVIVDESSMVGEAMYDRLCLAARSCRIMWVGDPAQLSPVRDGDASPVWDRVSEQVRLTEIVRQADGSGIAQASLMVRRAIEEGRRVQIRDLAEFDGKEILLQPGGIGEVAALVADGIRSGLDCRAIGYTNKATMQVIDMVHAELHPPGSPRFMPGDSVVFARQHGMTAEDRLTNNLEGSVVRGEGDRDVEGVPCLMVRVETPEGQAVVPVPVDADAHEDRIGRVTRNLKAAHRATQRARNEQTVATHKGWLRLLGIYRDGIADLRHTYASTAHKAQGSTYDAAVLHWRDLALMRDDVEFNRAVYVALTRPSKFLCVVA